jgi:hypothetical protein
MANKFTDAVFRAELKNPEKAVLAALAQRTNDEGICWPSYSRLAADAGVSDHTAVNKVKLLREKGLVTVIGSVCSAQGQDCNKYQLSLPAILALPSTGERGRVKTAHQSNTPSAGEVVKGLKPDNTNKVAEVVNKMKSNSSSKYSQSGSTQFSSVGKVIGDVKEQFVNTANANASANASASVIIQNPNSSHSNDPATELAEYFHELVKHNPKANMNKIPYRWKDLWGNDMRDLLSRHDEDECRQLISVGLSRYFYKYVVRPAGLLKMEEQIMGLLTKFKDKGRKIPVPHQPDVQKFQFALMCDEHQQELQDGWRCPECVEEDRLYHECELHGEYQGRWCIHCEEEGYICDGCGKEICQCKLTGGSQFLCKLHWEFGCLSCGYEPPPEYLQYIASLVGRPLTFHSVRYDPACFQADATDNPNTPEP